MAYSFLKRLLCSVDWVYTYEYMEQEIAQLFGGNMVLLGAFFVWSLFWKGLALWHSAKRGERWWFVAFLIVNLMGILEVYYLFFVAKIDIKKMLK